MQISGVVGRSNLFLMVSTLIGNRISAVSDENHQILFLQDIFLLTINKLIFNWSHLKKEIILYFTISRSYVQIRLMKHLSHQKLFQ